MLLYRTLIILTLLISLGSLAEFGHQTKSLLHTMEEAEEDEIQEEEEEMVAREI